MWVDGAGVGVETAWEVYGEAGDAQVVEPTERGGDEAFERTGTAGTQYRIYDGVGSSQRFIQ